MSIGFTTDLPRDRLLAGGIGAVFGAAAIVAIAYVIGEPAAAGRAPALGSGLHAALHGVVWILLFAPAVVIVGGLWLLALRLRVARQGAGQEKAAQAAEESDARFNALIDLSPIPTIVSRLADGIVLRVNPAFSEMMGCASEAIVGKPAQTMWADPGERDRMIGALRQGRPVRGMEMHARTASGAARDGLTYAQVIRYGGEPALLACAVDISEQKRVFADRLRADARLAAILEISPDAILTLDSARRITHANRAAERHFGVAAETLIGHDIVEMIVAAQRPDFLAQLAAFARGDAVTSLAQDVGECRARRGDASEFPAKLMFARAQAGAETFLTVLLRDRTERKATEAALIVAKEAAESANVAKSAFLANMSHELRTPLNAILGFSEIMMRESYGPLGDRRYKEYAGDILDSGTHLLNVINDILDLAKVEAGRLDLANEEHAIDEIVKGALTLVRERARRNKVELRVEIAERMPVLRCDGRKLKQVILNLVTNAVKFTLPGGCVATKAWVGPDGVVIQVADNGIGMRVEDVPRAFAAFGQIDTGLDRAHEGTGLGLPLSRSLIELHGGTLDLQSALGEGTTATVRLPAWRVLSATAAPRAASA